MLPGTTPATSALMYLSVLSNCFYLPPPTPAPGSRILDQAEETQHAMCEIVSGELQAAANVSLTRQLRGVCTASALNSTINKLETKIMHELQVIKNLLITKKLNEVIDIASKMDYPEISTEYSDDSTDSPGLDYLDLLTSSTYYYTTTDTPSNKYLEEINNRRDLSKEILQFNNTIQSSMNGNIYSYFWIIEDAHAVLKKTNVYISSPHFYLMGHQMELQIFPNHLRRNSAGMQLRPFGNFQKKYQIVVLHPFDSSRDIQLEVIGDVFVTPKMVTVENEELITGGYINDKKLCVKCIIFLNS